MFLLFSGATAAEIDSIPIMKRMIGDPAVPSDKRVKFINILCARYWTIDADSSLLFGWKGLQILDDKVAPRNAGYLHFVLGMAWENKGNFDSTLWYLSSAAAQFRKIKEERLYNRTLEQIGNVYSIKGQYDTAKVLIGHALEYFRSTGNKYQISSTLFNLGSVFLEQSRYNQALRYFLEASVYDSARNDTTSTAIHYLGIGNVYLNLGELFKPINPKKAKEYFMTAISYFDRCYNLFQSINHNTGICFSAMNLLSVYVLIPDQGKADSIYQANQPCLEFPDPRVILSFSYQKAMLWVEKQNYPQAIAVLESIDTLENKMLILPEYYNSRLLLARLKRRNGNNDVAFRLADMTIAWAKENSVFTIALEGIKLKAEWMNVDGKPNEEILLIKDAMKYKDSLSNEIGIELFDEVALKFGNQILEGQISQLNIEKDLHESRSIIFGLAASLVVLLLCSLLVYLWSRQKQMRQQRLLMENERKQMEQENQVKNLTIEKMELDASVKEHAVEQLKLEVQMKEQDLVYQTLLKTDLTQVNRSVKEKLLPYQYRFSSKKDQNEFVQSLNDITREANLDPLAELEAVFNQKYQAFYDKLLTRCPSFSKNELQVCALLRINLSTKDIARLLNISASSIDMTRYRIRQKLELDQKESLTTFLIML